MASMQRRPPVVAEPTDEAAWWQWQEAQKLQRRRRRRSRKQVFLSDRTRLVLGVGGGGHGFKPF